MRYKTEGIDQKTKSRLRKLERARRHLEGALMVMRSLDRGHVELCHPCTTFYSDSDYRLECRRALTRALKRYERAERKYRKEASHRENLQSSYNNSSRNIVDDMLMMHSRLSKDLNKTRDQMTDEERVIFDAAEVRLNEDGKLEAYVPLYPVPGSDDKFIITASRPQPMYYESQQCKAKSEPIKNPFMGREIKISW
jgi:arsenate reductase-like glutaredoxin family protein